MMANKEGLLVEIRVAKELGEVELPTFSYNEDSRTLHIQEHESPVHIELVERLRAIEGAFSMLGLESIDFTRLGRHWYRGRDVSDPEETIFKDDADHGRVQSSDEIIPQQLMHELLHRALEPKLDHFGLSFILFRQGWQEFCNFQYVTSIWFFSFFLEHAFANGKIKTKQQAEEYMQSKVFEEALTLAKTQIGEEVRRGDISRKKAEELLINKSLQEFSDWVPNMRGFYLHQSNKQAKSGKSGARWHPSDAIKAKADAVCLATFSSAASKILFDTYCGSHNF